MRVPVAGGPADLAAIELAFHAEHRRKYTFSLADTPIELVTFHLATHRRTPKPALAPWRGGVASRGAEGPQARRLRRRRRARDRGAPAGRSAGRLRRRGPARDRGGDDDRARPSGPGCRIDATATSWFTLRPASTGKGVDVPSPRSPIGLVLGSHMSPEDIVPMSQLAERLGFGELWRRCCQPPGGRSAGWPPRP